MELWNVRDMGPPALSRCQLTVKGIDIKLLDATIKESIAFFTDQRLFSVEAAVISRTTYKMKMKFRNSKDFKTVEKLNRALHAYLKLNFVHILQYVHGLIPRPYNRNKVYSLSKNIIDFVLVRLQGLAKIICRILETCKVVAILMQQRLRLGHFWKIALVILSFASRVFVISKHILKHVCELYGKLLPFSTILNKANVDWLPDDYKFPENLEEWLQVDRLDLEKSIIEISDDDEEPSLFSYLQVVDSDDDVEFCDEYILLDDDSFFGTKKPLKTVVIDQTDDVEVQNVVIDQTDTVLEVQNVEEEQNEEIEVDVGEEITVSSDDEEVKFVGTSKLRQNNKPNKRSQKRKRNQIIIQSLGKTTPKKKKRRKKQKNTVLV